MTLIHLALSGDPISVSSDLMHDAVTDMSYAALDLAQPPQGVQTISWPTSLGAAAQLL